MWMAVMRPSVSKSKVTVAITRAQSAEQHARPAVDLDEFGVHVGRLDALVGDGTDGREPGGDRL